jgi:hypothetical protein
VSEPAFTDRAAFEEWQSSAIFNLGVGVLCITQTSQLITQVAPLAKRIHTITQNHSHLFDAPEESAPNG